MVVASDEGWRRGGREGGDVRVCRLFQIRSFTKMGSNNCSGTRRMGDENVSFLCLRFGAFEGDFMSSSHNILMGDL